MTTETRKAFIVGTAVVASAHKSSYHCTAPTVQLLQLAGHGIIISGHAELQELKKAIDFALERTEVD